MTTTDGRAGAEEEIARRRFGLWALVALAVMLPPWWWGGADLAAAALRPLAALALGLSGLGQIEIGPDGAWLVHTGMSLPGGGAYAYDLPREVVRRLLLGFPLFAAFVIAPPRPVRPWRAAIVAAAVLAVTFALSLTAFVWGELAPMLNPDLAPGRTVIRLQGDPVGPLATQAALVGRYFSMSVGPLLAAVVLWMALNPAGRRVLLGGFRPSDADPVA